MGLTAGVDHETLLVVSGVSCEPRPFWVLWENHGEPRPSWTAVDEDESAVRLDGAMHDGEAEPAAVRFGGEERVEHSVANLGREFPARSR